MTAAGLRGAEARATSGCPEITESMTVLQQLIDLDLIAPST